MLWTVIGKSLRDQRRALIGAGLPPAYLWLMLPAAVVVLAAVPVFNRRDITAH